MYSSLNFEKLFSLHKPIPDNSHCQWAGNILLYERIISLVLILFLRKWSPGIKGVRAGCHGFIDCLPELIHACGGKDHVFSSMMENELPAVKMKQVRPLFLCFEASLYFPGNYTKSFLTLDFGARLTWV